MSDEQSLRAAVALAQASVLTSTAARAMDFYTRHGVTCEARQTGTGELRIIYRERWYTPAAFNALIAADSAPENAHSDAAAAATTERFTPPVEAWVALRHSWLTNNISALTISARDNCDDSDDLDNCDDSDDCPDEGRGALAWALLAVMVVGALFAATALCVAAHVWMVK